MQALVIGNGESRLPVDLSKVCKYKTIGCNAIYRDLIVDILICVDKRMVGEACDNGFTNPIYTRKDWYTMFSKKKNVHRLPHLPYTGKKRQDDPFHWGSGPYALYIGLLSSNIINIIGFDLYSSNKLINNVYKNTENYNQSTHHAIDPSYWIYQSAKLFSYYPKKQFRIYQSANWNIPASWQLPNIHIDNIENFKYNY